QTQNGHLWIGGCDTLDLAHEFGTPLYVFDEATIRARTRAYKSAFESRYPKVLLCYAAKAFLNPWLAKLLAEEHFGLDVVSGGEMTVAQRAGFPMAQVHLHGNNKLPSELEQALELGVGRIVIDNFTEIPLLEDLAATRGVKAPVWLRIAPGVEAHTHEYLRTGGMYSKFGIPLASDQAADAARQLAACEHLDLVGFHAHIGSQIFDVLPFRETVERLMDSALQMCERHGFQLLDLSPGGGLGIQYQEHDDPPEIEDVADAITGALRSLLSARDLPPPRLVLEPGRSIVGQAGVTLYTAGSVKQVPGKRTFVAVDGGMADNIRPALYQAEYQALVANKPEGEAVGSVTIAGRYCESGDLLVQEAQLPLIEPGDVIALPATGAYCIPLASNYNLSLRPPIVAVAGGHATLVRRRETYDDLLACEVA
ncbi:MAG TPA: diaminopimelate decarboxylase, partial [Chloroflexota bacterium]